MGKARETCCAQEQPLVDELTEAIAMKKSLKEDLSHAEGALYTAVAVCELAQKSEAKLKAELEDSRRSANDTKMALEARLIEMEHRMLRPCAPRAVGTPLKFVATLVAFLLMRGSWGSLGSRASIGVSSNVFRRW